MIGRYDIARECDCNARGALPISVMKFGLLALVVALIAFNPTSIFAQRALPEQEDEEAREEANELAKEVWRASGGENWSKVRELRFTCHVEQDGKEISRAEHEWKTRDSSVRVTWNGKVVVVHLLTPPQDEDGKAAFARWTDDSWWLLAPLKLLDYGVKLDYEGRKKSEGVEYETARVRFEVGLKTDDQYLLYIDPKTEMVRAWDYIPKAGNVVHGTSEKYETFGGLKLATEHNFDGKKMRFTDIEVKTGD